MTQKIGEMDRMGLSFRGKATMHAAILDMIQGGRMRAKRNGKFPGVWHEQFRTRGPQGVRDVHDI